MKSPLRSKLQATVRRLAFASCVVALVSCYSPVLRAQGTLAFSYEEDPVDFSQLYVANSAIPNSSTVTQDAIGATDGTKSAKLSIPANEGYAGILAQQLDPSIFGNPPGIMSMTFDLTIETAFPEEGFVDIFVVFFGIQQGTVEPGYEVSFQFDATNRVAIGDLAPGTHLITMEFNDAFHPLDFEDFSSRPYNEIFGDGSNPIDMIATGFQITVNKSLTTPWVGYIDNVRISDQLPVVQPGDFDGDGDVDGRDLLVWQRGETTPALDPALLTEWQTYYGTGGLAAIAAVPEPAAGLLMLSIFAGMITTSRNVGNNS